jgi:hypothetical protein
MAPPLTHRLALALKIESGRPQRTPRRTTFLAYFDTADSSNGGTEALNGLRALASLGSSPTPYGLRSGCL